MAKKTFQDAFRHGQQAREAGHPMHSTYDQPGWREAWIHGWMTADEKMAKAYQDGLQGAYRNCYIGLPYMHAWNKGRSDGKQSQHADLFIKGVQTQDITSVGEAYIKQIQSMIDEAERKAKVSDGLKAVKAWSEIEFTDGTGDFFLGYAAARRHIREMLKGS
jgi:hypothetical protein